MRVILTVVIAALSFIHVGICDKITFTGSPAARANIMILSSALAKAYKAPALPKRQEVQFEGRGIQIGGAGGITVGGSGGKDKKTGKARTGGATARNQTAENLAALEGARQRANGTASAGGGLNLGAILAGGSRGDKASQPAAGGEKAQPAKGEEAAAPAKGKAGSAENGGGALKESEQFKDNAGITVDRNGNTKNVGGNLGITKGSDGSTSVGGASGINILSVEEEQEQEAQDAEDSE